MVPRFLLAVREGREGAPPLLSVSFLVFFYGCSVLCSTPRGAAAALKHASRHAGDEDDGGEEGAKTSIMPRTLIAPLNHIFSPPSSLPLERIESSRDFYIYMRARMHLSLPLLWCRLTLCFLLL